MFLKGHPMTGKAKTCLKQSVLTAAVALTGGLAVLIGGSSALSTSTQAHGLAAPVISEEKFFDSAILDAFYQERNLRPVWLRGIGDFQPRAEGVLKILEQSWTHGLNPAQYHVERIRTLLETRSTVGDRELDRLISDAVIRYGRDLTGLRNKNHVRHHEASYWRQPMDAQTVLSSVAAAADPVTALQKLEPSGHLYIALRRELIRLAGAKAEEFDRITIHGRIKPGETHKAIPLIRQRLGVSSQETASAVYDDELAARVMTLQRSYGLEDNGVITPALTAVLNKSATDKIAQIIANMERLRWLDQEQPARYVLVNIPSARLWAVENGEIALEMPVIIGKEARPTYSFKTEISGVRFNPNWTVPPTIKKDDFLPMLLEDPYALSKRGIEMIYQGKTVDPGKVDWSLVNRENILNVRMVQAPGEDNPLGKVRVIMDNPFNIYLHDTNNRSMFSQKERALSSGCIRVERPEELASFILKKNKDWNEESLRRYIDSQRMRDIATDEKIPVFITYQTIWLDPEGGLVYGNDVYGQDKRLVDMLKKSHSIHIPSSSKDSQISL